LACVIWRPATWGSGVRPTPGTGPPCCGPAPCGSLEPARRTARWTSSPSCPEAAFCLLARCSNGRRSGGDGSGRHGLHSGRHRAERGAEVATDRTLWHLGQVTSSDRAESIVDAFRANVEVRSAMVAPWNRRAGSDTAAIRVADSLWGVLLGERAECRWRCEGDRVSVSIVSEVDLGAQLQLTCDGVESTCTLLADAPFWRGAGGRPRAVWAYRRPDGERLTRTEPGP
jgi:hypothetical protein